MDTSSSNFSTAFHYSSSCSSLSSTSSTTMPTLQTGFDRTPSSASAPLPSPTFQQHQTFASFHTPPASTTQPSHPQQPQQMQQNQPFLAPPQPSQPQQHLQQQPQGSVRNQYQGQRGGHGGPPETTPFLQDFTLIAEAAKRAEMACLMRDLEGCEL